MEDYKYSDNFENIPCFEFLYEIFQTGEKKTPQNDPNFSGTTKFQISKIKDCLSSDDDLLIKQIYALSYSLSYKIETTKSGYFDIDEIMSLLNELLIFNNNKIMSAALHCLSNLIFCAGELFTPMIEKYNLLAELLSIFDIDTTVDILTNCLSCINNILAINIKLKGIILESLDFEQLHEIMIINPNAVQFVCEILIKIISLESNDDLFYYQVISMFESVNTEYKKILITQPHIDAYTSMLILFCHILKISSTTYMSLVDTDIPSLGISLIGLENEGLSLSILVFLSQTFTMKSKELSMALYREINIDQLALFASVASESERAVALNVTANFLSIYPEAAHLECVVNLFMPAMEIAFDGPSRVRGCSLAFICRLFIHASELAKEYMVKNRFVDALVEALGNNLKWALQAADTFVNFAAVNHIDQDDIDKVLDALEEFSDIQTEEYTSSKAMVLRDLLNSNKDE